MSETPEDRDARMKENELVFVYTKMRLNADRLRLEATAADRKAREAELKMQEAWRACRHAQPGVYSFKDLGRTAIVVDPTQDYPPILEIR